MLKRLLTVTALLAVAALPALGGQTASKDGTPIELNPSTIGNPTAMTADFEYNTGGAINTVPTTGGSATGWAEWFVTSISNSTGQPLLLIELGFPCAGPPTGAYGWLVWTNVGGLVPPPGPAQTANYYGPFTPVDPDPTRFPPTTYTYIDITAQGIIIPPGNYFAIGYDNTGMGGMIPFNGVATWGWYGGVWDPDQDYGRTAILQVKANFAGTTAAEPSTWGRVKALF